MADLDSLVEKTASSLGKVIKKPPLTDKLLRRPPFRFLHDVIMESTMIMPHLLAGAQDSGNIKDKQQKMDFLDKAIFATAFTIGKSLSAKSSKIVAGHDPENTNVWLQAMAYAVRKKLDSSAAVQRVLAGEKPASKSSKSKSSAKDEEGKSARKSKGDASQSSAEAEAKKAEAKAKAKAKAKAEAQAAEAAAAEAQSTDEENMDEDGEGREQGALMRKIMEKKAQQNEDVTTAGPTTQGSTNQDDAQLQLERQQAEKEVLSLQMSVQTLCRCANPLGRIIDYIQEDVDSMRKELLQWREEYQDHAAALNEQERETEGAIEPLKAELADYEQRVRDKRDAIANLKVQLLDNEQKLQRLMMGVAASN
ncbi:uncharacterized protein MONBRDRAFT_16803 [Monosiga brevicollis MX1]|uniref:TRAF3-interacting protein 1 n=1 Tax=Monosiga brevicollis TaxID=81824 RepID=A9UXI1_MONBE|nr:uncharacterized protein MONBRDRAFT_16803 [Monosiga brevicollis MX1]EDQ89847.1 predicted protein [Monosiga brevicollis MX1]|eukprot:XP_001745269.1 hypothetical protein [Monosiga brevicollis MX1]